MKPNRLVNYYKTLLQKQHLFSSKASEGGTAPSLCPPNLKCGIFHSMSTDTRLQPSLFLSPEHHLLMLHGTHVSLLHGAVSAPILLQRWKLSCAAPHEQFPPPSVLEPSCELLSQLFERLLLNLSACNGQQHGLSIENVLELWLSFFKKLSIQGMVPQTEFVVQNNSSSASSFILSDTAISSLLKAILVCNGRVSLNCWSLLFYVLLQNLIMSHKDDISNDSKSPPKVRFLDDPNLVPVIVLFLTSDCFGEDGLVGGDVCASFHCFFKRLMQDSDHYNALSENGNKLKTILLQVVAQMLRQNVAKGIGPLDAQCVFMKLLDNTHFIGFQNIDLMLEIIDMVAVCIKDHLLFVSQSSQLFASSSGSSLVGSTRNIISNAYQTAWTDNAPTGLMANVPPGPKSDSSGQWRGFLQGPLHSSSPAPKLDTFLYMLISLCELLLESRINIDAFKPGMTGYDMVTDTSFVDDAKDGFSDCICNHYIRCNKTVNVVASVVARNQSTISLFLQSLSLCPESIEEVQMPYTDSTASLAVGLYQLLNTMHCQLTRPELLLQSLLRYMTSSLSENTTSVPFSPLCMHYFKSIVDCEKLLASLEQLNGIETLWQLLVRSLNWNSSNDKLGGGLVSVVMNSLSPSLPSSTVLPPRYRRADHRGAHTSYSMNSMVPQQPMPVHGQKTNYYLGSTLALNDPAYLFSGPQDTHHANPCLPNQPGALSKTPQLGPSSFVNFAPLAQISSKPNSVRSLQSLLTPVQMIQRSKNSSWSHNFGANENYITFTLKLPVSVLLHEVELYPYTAPSTYPSAVSVTAGVDGYNSVLTGLVPTDTLSLIKISLGSPTVASTVSIKLYKPKDSSTVGLSQIRLMGTTTFKSLDPVAPPFNGTCAQRTMHHFAECDWWLLMLRHCLTLCSRGVKSVIDTGIKTAGSVKVIFHPFRWINWSKVSEMCVKQNFVYVTSNK